MNSLLEILVFGTSGSTAVGTLDLFGDEPVKLMMGVSDIKDIKKRKSTFSQSFVLPGTKNNNTLFNHLFEIGSDSQFDPRKKTPCQLTVDSIPVMTIGNLQLTGIVIDEQNNISYEVNITDETIDLIDSIGSGELTDLEFSGLNHTWDVNNIEASWTGSNQSYFYPMIDYGQDLTVNAMKGGVPVEWLFPATQTKEILDRIFSGVGYTYTSTFLNTPYFKNLYIPFNGDKDKINDQDFANNRQFKAQPNTNTASTISVAATTAPLFFNQQYRIRFNNDTTYPNFDNGGLFNTTTIEYTSNTRTNQQFFLQLDTETNFTGGTSTTTHQLLFYRSSFPTYHYFAQAAVTSPNIRTQILFQSPTLNDPLSPKLCPAQPNERFWVELFSSVLPNGSTPYTASLTIYSAGTSLWNIVGLDVLSGQTFDYNLLIPKKIKQIDFLNSLVTMHNLYLVPDVNNPKNILIEPRDIYYLTGATKDWSAKLDISVKPKIQIVSEQTNKRIIFNYKLDNDYYNTDYKAATNKIFGEETYVIDNDFIKDDKLIDVIFSPTPSVPVYDSQVVVPINYPTQLANEWVIPKIGKVDSNNNFGKTDFNIRILQKNTSNLLPLTGGDYWKLAGTNIHYDYPYLGMLNHPFSATTDLSFGEVEYEYYELATLSANTLVDSYWRTYLDQIADKDSKIITCNIYLTPADIQAFKFSDSIFIDGLTTDGGHYFIVNSIQYSPTANQSSIVELIKVKEKTVIKAAKKRPRVVGSVLTSINIGGGFVGSTGSIGIGVGNAIGSGSIGGFVMGNINIINGGSQFSSIHGSGSTIGGGSPNGHIWADNSVILDGLPNVHIFAPDITASTRNTAYFNNINLTSGSTINGITIETLLSGSTLWSGGSGTSAIFNNNGTGNDAAGDYSLAEGVGTIAGGVGSHAEGIGTEAIGDYSHAEGGYSTTLGTYSHAEGYFSTASGLNSHAEGSGTTASGNWSHAEGQLTTSNSDNSHAEGYQSRALGNYTHTEGYQTTASGDTSHAEGHQTRALANYSHAEGATTLASGAFSHAEGDSTTASGIRSHSEGISTKALGNQSHAEGHTTTASGDNSHSEGNTTTASGNYSHAEGFGTIASGTTSHTEGSATIASDYSHAEGASTIASGDYSHAEGYQTTAEGVQSHAEGSGSTASGIASHSENYGTIASGNYSHAEGGPSNDPYSPTTASGDYSHAEGLGTTALGFGSHTEGILSKAYGSYSHAEGIGTVASGTSTHAEGNTTTASGDYSHAEGYSTVAIGQYSHAQGTATVASGDSSHAEGYLTTAYQSYSHAGGIYAEANHYGEWARSNNNIGQYGIISMGCNPSSNTTTELFLDAAGTLRFTIEQNYGYKINLYCLFSLGTNNFKEFEGMGIIKNDAGTVSLIGTFPTASTNSSPALIAATITVSADNTNKTLKIVANGINGLTAQSCYVRLDYVRIFGN